MGRCVQASLPNSSNIEKLYPMIQLHTITQPIATSLRKKTKAQLLEHIANLNAPSAPVASAPANLFAQVTPTVATTPVASAPVAPVARAKTGSNIGIPKDAFVNMVATAREGMWTIPNRPNQPPYKVIARPDGANNTAHKGVKVYAKPTAKTLRKLNGFATSDGHLIRDLFTDGLDLSIAVAMVNPKANVSHPLIPGKGQTAGLLMSESSLGSEFKQTIAMQNRGLDHSGQGFIAVNGSHMPRVALVQAAQAPAPVVKDVEDTVTINGRTYVATVA